MANQLSLREDWARFESRDNVEVILGDFPSDLGRITSFHWHYRSPGDNSVVFG
jgi:hypothetical protein